MAAETSTTIARDRRGISRTRIIVVHYLLGFLILGSALSFATGFEIWPFTPYRMYATLRTSDTVSQYWLYGITRDDGAEFPLWEARYTVPVGGIIGEYISKPQEAGPALQAIAEHYEELRRAGRHDGPPLRGIRFYRVDWDLQPDVGNAAQPDRRELLAEWAAGGRR